MAKLKTAKNMMQNRDEYARFFSNFRGVDFSSDHTEVADQRFAYLVNMWRDYKSGEGGAVETIPGYRRVYEVKEKIYGVHEYENYLVAHVGDELRIIGYFDKVHQTMHLEDGEGFFLWESDDVYYDGVPTKLLHVPYNLITKLEIRKRDSVGDVWEEYKFEIYRDVMSGVMRLAIKSGVIEEGDEVRVYFDTFKNAVSSKKSTWLIFNNRMYILDGYHFYELYSDEDNAMMLNNVLDDPYVPTTHELIYPGSKNPQLAPGVEMEQRNILTPKYKNKFVAGTDMDADDKNLAKWRGNVFQLKYGADYAENGDGADKQFPEHINVYQYGVRLPWAIFDYSGSEVQAEILIPKGYPNAVVSVTKSGEVTLVKTPPKPEENTWNPEKIMDSGFYKGGFDYTDEEIKNGKPKTDGYKWPFAYAETYDGIEITAENAITNINGIEAKGGPETIITHCTIATIFDNRLFLSGNPEFPTHIFWSGLNGETTYPDPTFFGITNNDIEGVTNSPVMAMIPVADQLMVLKKENASEGSVIFHTPTIGDSDVMPKIYPSTQGLPGRGCLGAACNFLDDPVFISRLGLEAMGQLSARYERAIEHRSSLIDSKLLGCDLSKAQLIEYEGYLLLLVDGKIFMADSRQTFTHDTGVRQYEWYYLEDIGVWEGQVDEYVFAERPQYFDPLFNGDPRAYRNEFGEVTDILGKTVDLELTVEKNPTQGYYSVLMPRYDELGRESPVQIRMIVEPTGAMIGGSFIPAERLYVIGDDLYFSAGKYLCKFYFDKRDKSTGIIPVEYYNFDKRRIFSGCATKMDNCGIPHLVKNTVKRSTVIKTRTYTHSFAKIKVRTNRKAFSQVGRIINGHEVFEGMDFSDFTFNVDGKTLFSINEKEKKWVEKQHFIYSDGYCEPFAIHYIAYRYNVAGRYKEK